MLSKTHFSNFLVASAFSLLFSTSAFAAGEAQQARFAPWLSVLEESLTSNPKSEKIADALLKGENRIAAFNLQALGKLYSPQDEKFSSLIRGQMKILEDGIGEYDKWQSIAKESGKKKDEAKAEEARKSFIKLLEKEKWIDAGKKDRLSEIKSFLKKRKWLSYDQDRSQIIAQLSAQLDSITETEYDLGRLEKRDGDGKGLHELRREIRWFMIEARVLNGLIQFQPETQASCSIPSLQGLASTSLAKSKYSTLPGSALETDPCYIEQCLFLGLSQSVNRLGELKDAAELDHEARESDRVPTELQQQAEDLYQDLKKSRIFSKLSQNLKQCQK